MRTFKIILYAVICLLFNSSIQAVTLLHQYLFNGDLSDNLGGPDLISDGETISNGSYLFGVNEGLSLDTLPDLAGNYSIGIQFSFQNVDDWRKVIDFKNLSPDTGEYILDGRMTHFDPEVGGFTNIAPNEILSVIYTRSGLDNVYTAYLNGNPTAQFSFNDTNLVTFALVNEFARFVFFNDDSDTSSEASAGEVFEIRVWDGPLSPEEIPFATIPEPSTVYLTGGGIILLLLLRLERGKVKT